MHIQAQALRLGTRAVEAVRVGVQTDYPCRRKRLGEQAEGLALAAAGIQQHRCFWQWAGEQAAQVIDRHAQHMVLPDVALQEPEAEAGFLDVGGGRVVHKHPYLLAGADFGEYAQAALGLCHIGVLRVPGIAREDRADHPADFRLGLLVIDHVLEAAVIPALDIHAEGVDAALEWDGKVLLPVYRLATELAVQQASSHARRTHGDGHPGAEHRVEELRRIAEQGKAWAVQGFDVGRVAANGARRGVPHGVFQHLVQAGGLFDKLLQAGVEIFRATLIAGGIGHYTDRAAAVAERDGPEPHVAQGRVGGDEDLLAVETGAIAAVFDVGKHCLAYGEARRRVEVEQARQHAAVAAAIEDEGALDLVFMAIGQSAHAQAWAVGAEINGEDFFFITNFHTLQLGLIRQ